MTWVLGVTPEVDAQSNYPLIICVAIIGTFLMLCVVGARLYVRNRIVKRVGVDDYIIAITAMFTVIYITIAVAQSRLGLGLPVALRPASTLDGYTKVNYAGRPFYNINISGFKVALCFSYLRISENSSLRSFRIAIWATMVFTILTHAVIILVLLFYCSPVQKAWNPKVKGTCMPTNPLYYGTSGVTIFCDLLVFFLPIPMILGLQMDRQRKLSLIFAFLLGLVTTVCSAMRLAQIPQVNKNGDATLLVVWALAEVNVGILTTSLPTLAPLYRHMKRTIKGTSTTGYTYDNTAPKSNDAMRMQRLSKVFGGSKAGEIMSKNSTLTTGLEHDGSQEDILAPRDDREFKREDHDSDETPWQIRKTTDVNISNQLWTHKETPTSNSTWGAYNNGHNV